MPSIAGIAHIQISVSNMERSKAFYAPLLHALEMETLVDTPQMYYCIGGKTGVAITPCNPDGTVRSFDQFGVGLHHFCFRARTRADVDEICNIAKTLGSNVVRFPSGNEDWAPGYYSTLFEDPDGIRIEVNHVPGKGHLMVKSD